MKRGWNLKSGTKDGDRGRRLGGQAHSREHLREIGKLGWKALVANRGLTEAHQKLREYRLAHPSELEQIVMDALADIPHEREQLLTDGQVFGYADFVIGSVALEVDGFAAHGKLTPRADEYAERKEYLCDLSGLELVRLPEDAVRDGSFQQIIAEVIG